ncbi:uncharacterized protein METZ01_LOCUS163034, partial [marine metagenome]
VGDNSSNKVTTALAKSANFSKGLTVFGINILATTDVPDAKLLHAANVAAELVDNNEDGTIDNLCVLSEVIKLSSYVNMHSKDNATVTVDLSPLDDAGVEDSAGNSVSIGLGHEETRVNYADNSSHDASIEEIFHLITQRGYSSVYPTVFGESNTSTSTLAKAMDEARGGEQRCAEESCTWTYNNTTCPDNGSVDSGKAWYFYSDSSADYATQMTEYIYWAVSSYFGMHDSPAGKTQADNEWCPNTKAELLAQDPTVYNLIDNSTYAFPSVMPDASYSYYTYSTSDIQTF